VGKFIHDAGREFQISHITAQKFVHCNVKLHVTKSRYSKNYQLQSWQSYTAAVLFGVLTSILP